MLSSTVSARPNSPANLRRGWFLRRIAPLLLFFVGVSALGYCGYVVLDARHSQDDQSRQFDQALREAHSATAENQSASKSPIAPAQLQQCPYLRILTPPRRKILPRVTWYPLPGGPLGRIEISSLGLTAMIQEGTGRQTLQRGVGHITGTALLGASGNVGLAGHRDTFFRKLRKIHEGDEITLTTLNGASLYRVDLISIVEPQDSAVLRDSGENLLTLVTCYPFSYVGPSPKRFIVRARQIPSM